MFNPYFLQKYAKMRYAEFLAEARQEQLLRRMKSEQPRLSQRVRWQVGDWLIGIGYKLKAQRQLILREKE
jgi:hypothetical protein